MRRSRFTEKQILDILKEVEGGAKPAEVCRKHGISEWTFYRWRSKYAGLDLSEAKRLRILEDENRRLKSVVADQVLEIQALENVIRKNS